MSNDRFAPEGSIWLCLACGKTAADRFGEIGPTSLGWDESCALCSTLVNKTRLERLEQLHHKCAPEIVVVLGIEPAQWTERVKAWLVERTEPPSFHFYAAHYLVGSGLTGGNLEGHVQSLAHEFKLHYTRGQSEPQTADQRAFTSQPSVEQSGLVEEIRERCIKVAENVGRGQALPGWTQCSREIVLQLRALPPAASGQGTEANKSLEQEIVACAKRLVEVWDLQGRRHDLKDDLQMEEHAKRIDLIDAVLALASHRPSTGDDNG